MSQKRKYWSCQQFVETKMKSKIHKLNGSSEGQDRYQFNNGSVGDRNSQ